MSLVFTPDDPDKPIHSIGDIWMLKGTLTFSGSYATGGDALDLTGFLRRVGIADKVICITDIRGNQAEYDNTNKKLKFYSAANTEMTAAAYNAALTGSPAPVVFIGR